MNEKYFENIFVGMRKAQGNTDGLLVTPSMFEGIERYIYVVDNVQNGRLTYGLIKKEHLEANSVTENQLWKNAEENTEKSTVVSSMSGAFRNLAGGTDTLNSLGIPESIMDGPGDEMYVASNRFYILGAGVVTEKLVKNIMAKLNTDTLIAFPSSVHEWIFVNAEVFETNNDASDMVTEINETTVSENERLSDNAFLIERDGDGLTVTIA